MKRMIASLTCLALWACDSPATEPPGATTQGEAAVDPSAGVAGNASDMQVSALGIGWSGVSGDAAFAFGAPREEVDEMLTIAFGTEPEKSANGECGAGPLETSRYGDAFTANFQAGKFAGWSLDEASEIATPQGLQVGSPRAMVAALRGYEPILQSSLGDEFTVGGVSGIYGEAGVDYLWAGANCIFR